MAETTKRAASDDTILPLSEKVKKIDPSTGIRVLTMSSVPCTWEKPKIANYIKEYTNTEIYKGIRYIYMDDAENGQQFSGTCHVRFASPTLCQDALTLLKNVKTKYDGRRIWVSFENQDNPIIWMTDRKPDIKAMKARAKAQKRYQQEQNYNQNVANDQYLQHGHCEEGPDSNIFQANMIVMNQSRPSNDTYGLSANFLESIGVTPPLTSKIFVDNLPLEYDDEDLIRKLFSHAGSVTSVAVITRTASILKLKVDFDHPVEAVQAITMFNNQEVYGNTLRVCMDVTHNAFKRFLPPGLKAFGPGLGYDGLPMKNVRNVIEMQKAVNMIMSEIGSLKGRLESFIEEYQRPDEYKGYNADSGSICSENHQQRPPRNTSQNQFEVNTPAMNSSESAATNIQNTLATLATTLTNPVANNPLLALGALLNPQTAQMLQLLTAGATGAGANLLTGLNTLQTQMNTQPQGNLQTPVNQQPQVNQTPQLSTGWDLGRPVELQNNLGPNNNMPAPPVVQSGLNMCGGMNMASGQSMAGGPSLPNMPSGPNMGGVPNVGAGQNMGGPNMMGGPNPRGGFQGEADYGRRRDDCSLLFNNLPSSVTTAALQSKMREFGEVRSAELTGPGRALVSFYSPLEAEACINLLDRTKVDGQTIEVGYLHL